MGFLVTLSGFTYDDVFGNKFDRDNKRDSITNKRNKSRYGDSHYYSGHTGSPYEGGIEGLFAEK